MSFDREKRLMLTWLLMLGPVPLPFNKILEWPVLFLYEVALVYYLQRLEQERPPVLPNWLLNVLGLAYMPLLAVDLQASFARNRPMAALLHLIMFLAAVKLYSLRREKEKWLMMIAAFSLFVGSMATSTHVSVALYLLSFTVLFLLVLARFAYLHMLAVHERHDPRRRLAGARPLRLRMPLAVGLVLIVLVAIPAFTTLPRLRDPFLMGLGGGASLIRSSGFSDSVDLSLTSSIRNNRDVVLRLKYLDGAEAPGSDVLRIKGATYDVYEGRRWHRQLQYSRTLGARTRVFEIVREDTTAEVEIFRAVINSRSLPLPMEATALELGRGRLPSVALDLGGAVYLPRAPTVPLSYKARVATQPRFAARLAAVDSTPVSPYTAVDQRGVWERLRQLARDVMGEGSGEERIARLESHLISEYAYTTTFIGREGEQPIEDFLFTYRSGHCELFATAMVLMLRAEGIPARFSTGFLGAELNPLEGYFIVRQENAHAWVEAYVEGSGWRVYDPTPPEGRPSPSTASWLRFMNQLYDYVYFRWDRYVLTFGAEDQESFFEKVRERLEELWKQLAGLLAREKKEPPGYTPTLTSERTEVRQRDLWLTTQVPIVVAVALFLGALAALIAWHRRRPLDAGSAYRKLRRLLGRAGLAVTESLAPLELERLAAARFPSAAGPARRLTALYLRESFGEVPLVPGERAELLPELKALRRAVHQDQKRHKKNRPFS